MSGGGRVSVDQLIVLWDDGERRLRSVELVQRRFMERIIDAIMAELRRRLGSPFEAEELGDLYMQGTEWAFELATKIVPDVPEAWDMPIVVGTAFNRYVRRAMDFGGGRRRITDEDDEQRQA